ncbi:sensor histidine kinase [Saccharicrinis sp. FJH54]|uniref:sensor histidine kinase n=1 Tax=Saccharicrinis sp. FJH54 TaxID=3344665 RepID=UPI0035D47CC9
MLNIDFTHINKIWLRLFIIYSVCLLIKAFDLTFGGFFDITFRGLTFTIFFLGYWYLVWHLADRIENTFQRGNMNGFVQIVLHLTYGYFASIVFNMSYRIWDTAFYGNGDEWARNRLLNPELTVSLTLFYFLIYVINQYFRSNITAREKQIRLESLEKEAAVAQYRALKSQIEPHFLFNSLSVLSSVVYKDADMANKFIIKLSRTLRYVIEKNEHTLVKLQEELQIVSDYIFLLKVRFGESIVFNYGIPPELIRIYLVPPVSVQLLVENAVNHNSFSEDNPLNITIKIDDGNLVVSNNINKRKDKKDTTGLGLLNLSKRFKLVAGKDIQISDDGVSYIVCLPLLTSDYSTASLKKPIQQ